MVVIILNSIIYVYPVQIKHYKLVPMAKDADNGVSTQSVLDVKALSVGVKLDQGKWGMSLLSGIAIREVGIVGGYGAMKYADHNWRKGMKWSRLFNAAQRHQFSFWYECEDKDKESQLYHLAHAIWNLMGLLEFLIVKNGMDDRYHQKPGVAVD